MLATLYGCIKRRLTTKIANEVTTIKNGYNYLKGTEFLLKFDEKRQFLGLSCCDQTALQQEWKMGLPNGGGDATRREHPNRSTHCLF